ncbi:periplasmic chaperone for outer membrane proteins SurA [Mariniphaga anaerophila]|uniref:Periplasmic chaperone for outer membrane proteins SurA n=1 Tax=Mariniphaga anaerophila TaxID=1484053 RepID=A0A1M4WEC7_9BACT|nr:peptidylprolyl isomerase [Mariniphaga anaerophila]SHE79520.1 periplasmic chaperone for outer membrane proteins SurA [Mariniphaga anaerophila]
MRQNNALQIAVFALFAIFATNSVFAQDKVVDQIVAVVGGNIVLKSDIEKMYMDQQAQGITSDGDMKCEILENFLIDKLLVAEAELDTLIEVTDSQVNQQMDGQIQMYVAHFGSENAVESFFKKPIADIKAEMRLVIRDQLLSSQMRNKIIQDITVTPSEVRQFFRTLPEEEVPIIPTQYEYAQITMRPEIELEEENRVKAELRELKKRIEGGSSFAAMAVLYSEGPSAGNGGEIGYLGRAQLDPEYAAAAFNLRGDKVSNVVKSEFGYHIIQLIDRRGDKVNTRHILMTPKVSPEAKELAVSRLDSLANLIRKEEISFAQAAARFSSDKNTRNNGGLAINPNTLSSKFTLEELEGNVSKVVSTLKIGEISDPIETVDSESRQSVYTIIKMVDKIEGHKANLQNDYQQLSDLFLAKKREETLQKWIADKQAQTYIRIDNTYANCNFEFDNWVK